MNRISVVNLVILVIGFSLFSCSAAQSQSKKSKNKEEQYEEDLSKVRPVYKQTDSLSTSEKTTQPVVPSNDITDELNAKIDTLAKRSPKTTQGFRVLVYSGKSSAEVKEVRTKVYQTLPDANIYQDFKSPNQRVKVGDCIDRMEAYILHGKLKKDFPNSVIIPDQVNLKVK